MGDGEIVHHRAANNSHVEFSYTTKVFLGKIGSGLVRRKG